MEKLLSIIIPTKNRYETLGPIVNGLLTYLSPRIEIVIQDNSADNTNYYKLGISSDLVKYYHTKDSIPISDNTILAIEHSVGKYILFIGDDDFVTPYIDMILSDLCKFDIACLTYSPGYYWWDSVTFLKPNYYENTETLIIDKPLSNKITLIDTKQQLKLMLKRGAIDYSGLPRLYHGIVKKEILQRVKKRIGSYLVGSCPDIAFSIELAMELDSHAYINYPITIFGASRNSGGGLTASKKHFMRIEEATFLRKNTQENWNPAIPKIWSQKSIYPQTTHEVLDAYNSKLGINYISFYASMLVYEPYLFSYIKPYLLKNINSPNLYWQLIRKYLGLFIHQAKMITKMKSVYSFKQIKSNKVYSVLKTLVYE